MIDSIRSLTMPTPDGDWFSAGVVSDGSAYGIPAGIVYSFPLRTEDGSAWSIVRDLPIDNDARAAPRRLRSRTHRRARCR